MLSQSLGVSFLFLDMTGTAIASLTAGMPLGILVALCSNWMGEFLPSFVTGSGFNPQTYKWFALANAAGAVVWAALPQSRLIVPKFSKLVPSQDILSNNTDRGYRRLLYQVFMIGLFCGLVVAISGFLIQQAILGCGTDPKICAATSVTASTATQLQGVLSEWIGFEWGARLTALVIFNIADKFLITALAVAVAFTLSETPNYIRQAAYYRLELGKRETSWKRTGLFIAHTMIWIFFAALLMDGVLDIPDRGYAALFLISFVAILLFSCTSSKVSPIPFVPFRSEDNESLFHRRGAYRGQSFQRDVFEDVFKIVAVLATTAYVLFLLPSPTLRFYELVKTVLLINVVRYAFVAVMRVTGRFDQSATDP